MTVRLAASPDRVTEKISDRPKIRDVSLGGIGLVLVRQVAVGSLLAVSLANPAQKFSKTVLVRVAHVTVAHGGFLIGGTFLEPLTYQEFTSLVM